MKDGESELWLRVARRSACCLVLLCIRGFVMPLVIEKMSAAKVLVVMLRRLRQRRRTVSGKRSKLSIHRFNLYSRGGSERSCCGSCSASYFHLPILESAPIHHFSRNFFSTLLMVRLFPALSVGARTLEVFLSLTLSSNTHSYFSFSSLFFLSFRFDRLTCIASCRLLIPT